MTNNIDSKPEPVNLPSENIEIKAGSGNLSSENIDNILTDKGVKPTSNRVLVLRELSKASRPLSLADLEEQLGFSVDKATIFRVLELFAAHDVVHIIEDGSRSAKYELCHSGHGHTPADEHVHFFCERCRQTFCFDWEKVPAVPLPSGFTARSVNYMIKGLCPSCSKIR